MEFSVVNYYRRCEKKMGFSEQDRYMTRVLVFIDNTIAYIAKPLQVSNEGGRQARVKFQAPKDAQEFVQGLETGKGLQQSKRERKCGGQIHEFNS